MSSPARFSLCLILLVLIAPAGAAGTQAPSFTISLEGVKFDYPGFEHWAEIECPDGTRRWVFARYQGGTEWSVPTPPGAAGTYRLLRVERRRGESREEEALASNSQRESTVREPTEPGRVAAGGKPLVTAGEFRTFFTAEEPWCVNDHTFAQGPDQAWHMFGITHPKPLSWEKDPGRQLAHATASSLRQTPWDARPFAVQRDWDNHHEYLLWAPFVVRHHGLYYMFVCVGDPGDHSRYRIHLLTSPDLEEWTRSPENPMVVDGFDARDPFVMRVGEDWVLYYTATSTPQGGNHVVACVTSRDLKHWANRQVVFTHPRAGSFGGPTESPFIVQRGGNYYLFACDNDWTDVYVSGDPFHWEFDQKCTRIRSHASEIVRDANGQWFISHAGWTSGPLEMAPLEWHDGLDDAPTNIEPARN